MRDLEAAAKLLREMVYGDTPERFWNDLAPGAQNTWVIHAKKIVEAALGDVVLYRIDPDVDVDVDSFVAVDPHTGVQRALIQV